MPRMLLLLLALAVSCTAPKKAEARNLTCADLPSLFFAFGHRHYTVDNIDETIERRTAKRFVESVDPSRTLLLEADATKLENKLLLTFESLRTGSCPALDQAALLVIERAKEDVDTVKAILGKKKFEIDESIELVTDPDKRGYAKTTEARKELVRKMVHFQMLGMLEAKVSVADAKKRLIHRYELIVKRLEERREGKEFPGLFAEAFAGSLDPHSSYFSARVLEDFRISMTLSLEGIGAALRTRDGFVVIETIVPGGAADRDGKLQPKDKIIAVKQTGEDAVSTIDMDLRDVVAMIRGKKGTSVTLSVLREGDNTKTFDITIVRDKVDVKEQAAKIEYEMIGAGKKKTKIGVIELPSFYGDSKGKRSSYEDMKKLLKEAKKKKVDGIVVDLSANGGGLLDEAVRIGGLFIDVGAVVSTKDSDGVTVLADEDDGVVWSGPLVVLVSPMSASASEILAGALQGYHRAVVVGGERTFGKGSVQALMPLPDGVGAMKVTTGMYFLPTGASTQQTGVASDIRIPSLRDGYDLGERELDYSLPPQSMPPFLSDKANPPKGEDRYREVSSAMITQLSKSSAKRVEGAKVFGEIKKDLEEAKKNQGVVKLKELLSKSKDKKGEKDDDGEAERKEFEAQIAAVRTEAVAIAADLARM